MNLAAPLTTVTPLALIRPDTPDTSFFTTLAFRFCMAAKSTETAPTEMPLAAASWVTAWYRSTEWIRDLVGMQPAFRQVPPRASFSIRVTSAPSWDARMAAT